MPYAVKHKDANSGPRAGQEIGWRYVNPGTTPETFEVLVSDADMEGLAEPLWDASTGKPRRPPVAPPPRA